MFHITNDPRTFKSLESAKMALILSVESHYLTAKLLNLPYSIPNWCVFDGDGQIICWADDCIPEADNAN